MPQHSSRLPSSVYVAIFNSMSQQNSSVYSGALLMKCHDRVIKCHDNTSLPSDFHCVVTFIYVLQHSSCISSHMMSQQSCEML